jgi:endonuclease/exonuclease/phosphatase family metal-dependent hydrolase
MRIAMPALTVATLNLLNNPHGRWADREPLVIDQARALDADVYGFQEVAARSGQIERLLEGLGDDYVAVPLDNPDRGSIKSLAVLTRLAVAEHDGCFALENGDIALRTRLEADGGQPLTFVTTHFHFSPTRAGSDCRRRQAGQLIEWLGSDPNPTVLCGDFNATGAGETIRLVKQHFRSSYEVLHGREPETTHPTPLVQALDPVKAFGVPRFPEGAGAGVDYIFVSEGLTVRACELAWTHPSAREPNLYPSDHFGLVARLEFS